MEKMGSESNTVYKVSFKKKFPVIIKIFTSKRLRHCINELAAIRYLNNVHFTQIPNIITADALPEFKISYMVYRDQDTQTLADFLSNTSRERKKVIVFSIGKTLACLHEYTSERFSIHMNDVGYDQWSDAMLEWLKIRVQNSRLSIPARTISKVDKYLESVAKYRWSCTPCFVHGDYAPNNILVSGITQKVEYLVDFEHSGFKPALWDFNKILYDFPEIDDYVDEFLRGYQSEGRIIDGWELESAILKIAECLIAIDHYRSNPLKKIYYLDILEKLLTKWCKCMIDDS